MINYTKSELRDLVIAFIIITIAFTISNVGLDTHAFISILPIIMVGVGLGFIFRELGQKFIAMKYGYQAEFKAWPIGLLIAIVSSFFGLVFAFPGEVKVYADNLSDEIIGRIAVAGPMANMVLALISLVIAVLTSPLKSQSIILELIFLIFGVAYSVNSFLAAFNLLPFYTLDGIKVMKWNVGVWIVVFVFAAFMMLLSITIGVENMVRLILDTY